MANWWVSFGGQATLGFSNGVFGGTGGGSDSDRDKGPSDGEMTPLSEKDAPAVARSSVPKTVNPEAKA